MFSHALVWGSPLSFFRNNEELKILAPASLTDDQKKDDFHSLVWQARVKKYVDRVDILEANKIAL